MKRKTIIVLIGLLVLLVGAFWLANQEGKEQDLTGSYLLPKLNMPFFVVKQGGNYAAYYPKKSGHYEYRKTDAYSSAHAQQLALPEGGVLISQLGVLVTVENEATPSKEGVPEYQLWVYAGKSYDIYQVNQLSAQVPDALADGSAVCDYRRKSLPCQELMAGKTE